MVICIDCGLDKVPAKAKGAVGVQAKRCLDCHRVLCRARNKRWYQNNKEYNKIRDAIRATSPTQRFHTLKNNAKRRNLSVELTLDEFLYIANDPCVYCQGHYDTDKGSGSHIDRLDNTKGYTLANSISCCGFCNKIKQDLLSYERAQVAIRALIDFDHRQTPAPV